jgi:hypothetical protein
VPRGRCLLALGSGAALDSADVAGWVWLGGYPVVLGDKFLRKPEPVSAPGSSEDTSFPRSRYCLLLNLELFKQLKLCHFLLEYK